MAKFTQNTLNQVAGFDGQILAQELVYDQKDFWNFSWATITSYTSGWQTGTTPVDLTGATIDAQIIRRAISNFHDSRTGLDFQINDYPLVPLVATVTASESTDNTFTCDTTDLLFINKPIQFTGAVFGGVAINTTYLVATIPTETTFTITDEVGNPITLTTETGSMKANTIKPTPINLPISNVDDAAGTFTMTIDDDTWGLIIGDPDLNINATEPACFTGRVKISFPEVGSQPAYDQCVFLLFLVNSDGVVNYG